MIQINENFLKLQAGYLFTKNGRRVSEFANSNPDAAIIKLGIGDVTEPLPAAIVAAMHTAVDEMAISNSFHGYGPEQGYSFLAETIIEGFRYALNFHLRNINNQSCSSLENDRYFFFRYKEK